MSHGERFQLSNLAPQYRRAGLVALLLFMCMFLPWYTRISDKDADNGATLVSDKTTLTAFESFSWVEAAILLVAIAVLALLYVRGQKRAFHLPGGDGTVIAAAGAWVCVLVLYRFIDNRDVNDASGSTDYGITWGIFITLLVALALLHAGLRLRAAQVAEPANPAAAAEPQREPAVRARGPLKVDDDTEWAEDEHETQVVRRGHARDPVRYDDPA